MGYHSERRRYYYSCWYMLEGLLRVGHENSPRLFFSTLTKVTCNVRFSFLLPQFTLFLMFLWWFLHLIVIRISCAGNISNCITYPTANRNKQNEVGYRLE